MISKCSETQKNNFNCGLVIEAPFELAKAKSLQFGAVKMLEKKIIGRIFYLLSFVYIHVMRNSAPRAVSKT